MTNRSLKLNSKLIYFIKWLRLPTIKVSLIFVSASDSVLRVMKKARKKEILKDKNFMRRKKKLNHKENRLERMLECF